MYLNEKIDEYSEGLFVDLGLSDLPEDRKAEIYARVQDHLHQVMFSMLAPHIGPAEISDLRLAVEAEDYDKLEKILNRHPQYRAELETTMEQEFNNLKNVIAEEQKNAGSAEAKI